MQRTTGFRRGDVVLVSFVFPDQSGVKRRPALVVSAERYHRGRNEVILAAITSNVRRLLPGDTRLPGWKESGLIAPSVVTGIVRTVKQGAIARRLGNVSSRDMQPIDTSLRLALEL